MNKEISKETVDEAKALEEVGLHSVSLREKHDKHQAMLEEHRQQKAKARENHRKGLHKVKYTYGFYK
jgi:hypothetical protein